MLSFSSIPRISSSAFSILSNRHFKIDTVSRALKHSCLVLAKGKNIEPPVAAEKGKKRLDVETVGHDNQFIQIDR